ncbi:MAG: RpiB/LacA/LacB family sugar-phosphate isomerase, partial [Eubacteriales bacterium]|nr:RpiB/LacA/LacB family sugar-phosphate isomerase [Eubacteriales bacterium]
FFLGQALQKGEIDRGIAICGTGLGISMAANKMEGIRAALCFNEYMAKMARNHNDANILALGARVIAEGLASSIVDVFFREEFEGGRHLARIQSIDAIGKGEFEL